MNILVTGATGYIGGRLVPRLLEQGYTISVLVRDQTRVHGRDWSDKVDVIVGDLLEPSSLTDAFTNIDAAYYLVHSMYAGSDFEARDKRAANNFADAAEGIKHVVYLGGLLPEGDDVSAHLSSRAEVGNILRERLPTTEFRAGPIIGSGSASFEMLRYLTERLPAMIAPKWIRNEVMPIAVRDILSYLISALEHEPLGIVSVGDKPLTFKQMMLGYAKVRGLKRFIMPVPVLAPGLAARWVGLVTPIPNTLAVPLVQGIVQPVVADSARAHEIFPEIEPISYQTAVDYALERTDDGLVETRWSGALGSDESFMLEDWEGLIREVQKLEVEASPEATYRACSSLGGDKGWLVWGWAWRFRGFLDQLVGGPGLRRNRRHPSDLFVGEAVDFWRVEAAEPPECLRLRAEMKVPGKAWLQFEIDQAEGKTQLTQTALFEPKGLAGTLYWYVLYPIHRLIFRDMVRAIAKDAQSSKSAQQSSQAIVNTGEIVK